MPHLFPYDNANNWYAQWSYLDSGTSSATQKLRMSKGYKALPVVVDFNQVREMLNDESLVLKYLPYETPADPELMAFFKDWVQVVTDKFAPYEQELAVELAA